MTRTGLSPRLGQHRPEPFVEIHPDDAASAGIVDGAFTFVETDHGSCVLKSVVTDRQPRGSLFAPIHWSGETAPMARIGALVAPKADPFSGQPEAKATPASVKPRVFARRGFVLARTPLVLPGAVWWARVALEGGLGYLAADDGSSETWRAWFRGVAAEADIAEYLDAAGGTYRAAAFADGALELCVFTGPADAHVGWEAIAGLLAAGPLGADVRRDLLSGRLREGAEDGGPIVCACFGVGRNTICASIKAGARSAAALGAELRAGTNCGSCVPELKRLIAQTAEGAQQAQG